MKQCYHSGAVKRKMREHAVNGRLIELSNIEIRFMHLEVVDSHVNEKLQLVSWKIRSQKTFKTIVRPTIINVPHMCKYQSSIISNSQNHHRNHYWK